LSNNNDAYRIDKRRRWRGISRNTGWAAAPVLGLRVFFACCALTGGVTSASDFVPAVPVGTSLIDFASRPTLTVIPETAPAHAPRMIVVKTFVSGCRQSNDIILGLDVSRLASDGVASIVAGPDPNPSPTIPGIFFISPCPIPPRLALFGMTFASVKLGTITINCELPLNCLSFPGAAPVSIQVVSTSAVPTTAATYDINGMWFDTSTNGSGISFHHRRTGGDVTFGTWFMFDREGQSRWYSLQATRWTGGGNLLEGLFIESAGSCASPSACPAKGSGPLPVYTFQLTFISATQATALVFGLQGEVLFRSDLRRLEQ